MFIPQTFVYSELPKREKIVPSFGAGSVLCVWAVVSESDGVICLAHSTTLPLISVRSHAHQPPVYTRIVT